MWNLGFLGMQTLIYLVLGFAYAIQSDDHEPHWMFVQNDNEETIGFIFVAFAGLLASFMFNWSKSQHNGISDEELRRHDYYATYAGIFGSLFGIILCSTLLDYGFSDNPADSWNQPESGLEKSVFGTIWGGMLAASTVTFCYNVAHARKIWQNPTSYQLIN